MKTITKLSIQQKDKNRVNLFLDNEYYCALNLETVVKHGLKENMMIVEEKIEQYQLESEKGFAFDKALKLINTRYKTQKEIYDYLLNKGYLPNVIMYVIDKLKEYNYINDKRYAESFVSHKIKKDGKLKIKQNLIAKGVSEDKIEEILGQQNSQEDIIKELSVKYMKNKEGTKENYIKLFRYLSGKGFEYDDIMKVLKDKGED